MLACKGRSRRSCNSMVTPPILAMSYMSSQGLLRVLSFSSRGWVLMLPLVPSFSCCWIQQGGGWKRRVNSKSVHPCAPEPWESRGSGQTPSHQLVSSELTSHAQLQQEPALTDLWVQSSLCMHNTTKVGVGGHTTLALFLQLLLLICSHLYSHDLCLKSSRVSALKWQYKFALVFFCCFNHAYNTYNSIFKNCKKGEQ